MNIVECEKVCKSYGQGKLKVQALRGIDLSILRGGFTALAGPSGSGKTTLLNLMGGLDRADSGSVRIEGRDLGALSQTELSTLRLRQVGFVFQSYNLIPVLSALENVEYVMLLQGVAKVERRERARVMLEEVGLAEMLHRRPAELSGGQQQRVAVARAMVSTPSIVLADEPTANLDSKTGRGLLEMMQVMNQSHQVTFIFATHDPMVMACAKAVVRLHDGRIQQIDS